MTTPATLVVPDVPAGSRRIRGEKAHEKHNPFAFWVLVVITVFLMVPVLWLIATSFKSLDQLNSPEFVWFPVPAHPENYAEVQTVRPFWAYAGNSLFLATVNGTLTTFSSALVGYGFARLPARGKRPLFAVLVAMMMMPPIITLIPTYLLFARIGLVGTYWPWVLWGIAGAPFLIFLFRQFFASLPRELEDAARLDGCSPLRIWWQIFLPLSKPILATAFVLSFGGVWGDFVAPSLLLTADNMTLAVAVATQYVNQAGYGLNHLIAAAAVLYVIPVVVLFLVAQRAYVSGFSSSGLKG